MIFWRQFLTGIFRDDSLFLHTKPHAMNIGMNLGRLAGAGIDEHLHYHIVPRWDGDTNFMAVCGDTDVISQSMEELYQMMKKICDEHSLPGI